tara:strand:+ start:400 stop:648 length:249 start_codon:yes stop_codon:yes gene_type:complete
MTSSQLNSLLLGYAKEDVIFTKENGTLAVINTLEGNIDISYSDDLFQAHNGKGEQLTYQIEEHRMINWLASKYDVSEVEVIN